MTKKIDRNAEQMLRYAKKASDTAELLSEVIKTTESVLEVSSPFLDDPSQKAINKLHECCDEYFKAIIVIDRISEDINLKAKRLKEIRDGGI